MVRIGTVYASSRQLAVRYPKTTCPLRAFTRTYPPFVRVPLKDKKWADGYWVNTLKRCALPARKTVLM
jgi:hypothetical protein